MRCTFAIGIALGAAALTSASRTPLEARGLSNREFNMLARRARPTHGPRSMSGLEARGPPGPQGQGPRGPGPQGQGHGKHDHPPKQNRRSLSDIEARGKQGQRPSGHRRSFILDDLD
ncbi:hypothetical protein FISHEDRAFT_68743 [Fistulina hepatica ATCC 64428]|uniref:Uncharacterized protein n=1 Tax=Fistulina hepatica ATCC 64428 TaxID=1128425 RepID=A0A0D7AP07_9AGAR|nr:hypothetical protein FISHEDRAFT_68743 [Fistulina hepatica ATCC 64428]